jgi:diguanylate cyclase (GGDEF)-like protein/PAS domain S-box-containing protein
MRIRTQLTAALGLASLVAVLILTGLAHVTRQAQAGLDEQAESQQVARDVANMLLLTNEFSVYGSGRAATQWRARHAQLLSAVDHAMLRHSTPLPELVALRADIDDLSALFDKLAEVDQAPASPLTQRRRDLLLERLLAETHEVVERRHRWSVVIGEARQQDQHLYTAMVLAAPAALLLLLLFLGLLIGRRVLKPLAQLKSAAVAMQSGDLDARCDSAAQDELGATARAVDAMARTLQQQSAALALSEHRLRMIADNMPALIAYIDRSETYRFTNAAHKALFGQEAEDYLGKTMAEVMGAPARAALAPHIEGVLGGERHEFEFERQGKGGAPNAFFMVSYVPEIGADGAVEGFYVMALDITKRKEAELRQAASERLLVQITDNLPALVAYVDRDMRYRFANGKYREWLGVDPRAIVGMAVSDAVGQALYAEAAPQARQALAGERVRWERQTVRDGQEVHYLADFIPDVGDDGRVNGFYALTVDITERRQAELEVARSEQHLFALTNNIPALVAYFDMEERCQYANDTALHSQNLTRATAYGMKLRDGLGEVNYAAHEPGVRQVLRGQRARIEAKVPFRGRDAYFQAHFIPDLVEGGAQRGFYLMTFDITALKVAQHDQAQVERQLRDITDNLPVLISYVDREERYVFVNATCEHWLGLGSGSLLGRTVAESMPPASYAQRRSHLKAALAGQRVEFHVEEAMALGAPRSLQSAYIPDVQPDGTVAGLYMLSTDVTALKDVERQLDQLARVDPLTGLPNRRQFDERLGEAISRASRGHQPIAVMFLDVDHFKSINDTLGHASGDAVLKEFGARLKKAVRVTDTAARLAGDEFVVLLEAVHTEADAEQVAKKIVDAIRVPFLIDGKPLRVTTSVGVAFSPRPAPDGSLMHRADEALYLAKGAGRDTFCLKSVDAYATGHGALAP